MFCETVLGVVSAVWRSLQTGNFVPDIATHAYSSRRLLRFRAQVLTGFASASLRRQACETVVAVGRMDVPSQRATSCGYPPVVGRARDENVRSLKVCPDEGLGMTTHISNRRWPPSRGWLFRPALGSRRQLACGQGLSISGCRRRVTIAAHTISHHIIPSTRYHDTSANLIFS
ncbi:hypothetical protein ABW21_db0200641 [Orbilia brochopaga]|nr:hypothetical protein ABW21_db0200641 [Drechslerella brochopaga]